MIYVELTGGLGNQLFQYAYGRKLQSIKKDKVTYLSKSYKSDKLRDLALNKFNIADSWQESNKYDFYKAHGFRQFLFKCINKTEHILKKDTASDIPTEFYKKKQSLLFKLGLFTHSGHTYVMPEVYSVKDIYADGLWHYPAYFEGIREKLCDELRLKDNSVLPRELTENIRNSDAVCVHIRRGDYLNYPNYMVCDIDYYIKAMSRMREMRSDCKFFVFSDDIEWVKANMPQTEDVTFVGQANPDYIDFGLMCECKHFIISNSTFSWWAAYLGAEKDKVVMTPDKWYNDGGNKEWLNLKGWTVLETAKQDK